MKPLSTNSPDHFGFTDPHVVKGLTYAAAVVAGDIPACKYVRQACARQLNDLEKYSSAEATFFFDQVAAGRACRFLELLPHVKGPKAKTKTKLEPWQCFIVTTVFGWLRHDTRGRRFRRVYLELPRGQGKSHLSSGIGLYGCGPDGEAGAEVYAAATTKQQARIVWDVAGQMIKLEPQLRGAIGLEKSKHRITHSKSGSVFVPMTRDANSNEGQNVHVAIVDELHAHQTRELYDVIETATAKRHSSLLWVITTAGNDVAGICYEVRAFVEKVLAGDAEDEAQFGVIYTLDSGDEWTDPKIWIKANPNWGVSVIPEVFESLANKAVEVPSARSNFLRKHLNVWATGDETWMDIEAWDRCADPTLKPESFEGQTVDIGLDLATKTDIAAKVLLFSRMQPGAGGEPERHFYLFLESYLPAAAAKASRNAQYSGWVETGHIRTTPGDVLDFEVIKRDLRGDRSRFKIHQVGFDPWQATQLSQEMIAEGAPMVEVRPTTANFSAPMKEWQALVLQGRLHHDGNPVLRWMLTNVVAENRQDNLYPRKERPELKIDGVVAGLIALNRAMTHEPPPEVSPYQHRGIRFL